MGKSSLGIALVAGKNLVPKPATGKTAFFISLKFDFIITSITLYKISHDFRPYV